MNHNVLTRAQSLSDSDLLAQLKVLAQQEREVTVALIAHLAVLDERRLHLAEGYSSLFSYCTQALHLSEHAAFGRIEAARAVRRFPTLLEMLTGGSLTLTTVGLLAPHLTPANHDALLTAARHKSKRQVEELLAQRHPLPDVPSTIRRLPPPPGAPPPLSVQAASGPLHAVAGSVIEPQGAPPSSPAPPHHSAVVAPLGLRRYRVQFTASSDIHDKLQLAQDLLRHQIPDGDLGEIMDRALAVLVETLVKEKFAATDRPRERRPDHNGGCPPGTHHIPADVKRAVWRRDGGRCAFVANSGHRCSARGFLEFHHIAPYAEGGKATVENIELRCRAHNHHEAVLHFGEMDLPVTPRRAAPCLLSVARSTMISPARAGPR